MKSGILPIHKPEGMSSAQVVARVKRALGAKKVGHTGTLDPFATGLLLCGIDQGTRISRFFLHGHKRYLAKICLGVETDTYDPTGRIVSTAPQGMTDALKTHDIEAVVNSFLGIQDQVAPAYSALKHEGRPLYELARQGKMIQKPPRRIEIFDISIKQIDLPYIDIDVFCSSGTYIRSLGFDIGRKLGCGAHLSTLCRTESGPFRLENAVMLDSLEKLEKMDIQERIIPLSKCLESLPRVLADAGTAEKIKFGKKLFFSDFESISVHPESFIRITDDGNNLLAIVQPGENGQEYKYSCVFTSELV
ncbi:MAG: tRNA pseudouridine(55) synthase TruB [Deltaproteobacteria bacterium RIFOXYC2_FULL_48_10]|nr:MAG: tRNA pseudouridine(55) synthase TruB [Deltaproteobacteria bacterium RIFOXYC2_FULL_48_10]